MTAQFPSILRKMLEYAERSGLASVVSWLPHGRAFKIHDERRFMDEVSGLFFRATKIRSFYRQLYFWHFERILTGLDRGAWHHESFVRDRPSDMARMVRTKIKGDNVNATESPRGSHSSERPLGQMKSPPAESQSKDECYKDLECSINRKMPLEAATVSSVPPPAGSALSESIHKVNTCEMNAKKGQEVHDTKLPPMQHSTFKPVENKKQCAGPSSRECGQSRGINASAESAQRRPSVEEYALFILRLEESRRRSKVDAMALSIQRNIQEQWSKEIQEQLSKE